jgi:hypothetical protein
MSQAPAVNRVHVAAQYFLNHHLRPDEVRAQVRAFAAAGYECLYPHARAGLTTPYLSEKWFEIIDAISEECRRCGLALAIWDEDYFPSPDAGNRVVWEHPEFRSSHLVFTVRRVPGGETAEIVLEPAATVLRAFAVADDGTLTDITAYAGSIRQKWGPRYVSTSAYSNEGKIGAPHRRSSLKERHFSVMWDAPAGQDYTAVVAQAAYRGGGHTCDILNPRAIKAFLGYTHEAYLKRYGDTFARRFVASFLDEPAPASDFPWTRAFPDEFRNEHGYDLLPLLPHLVLDLDARTPLIRHHYRLTQMRLQCDNYLAQMAAWCHDHGLASIGHLTRTEWLSLVARWWPNELRCCRYLDVPCTDPLGFHVALPDASAYHTGVKVVSSAARLFGKPQAGSDALAVMGNEASLRDLAYQIDFQLALGITYFNMHGLSCSLDGPRKDEVPPSIFYQHSEWPIMGELLRPLAAKCRRLSEGAPVRRLMVLYPSTSIYCAFHGSQPSGAQDHPLEALTHALAETLLSRHQDFDFIDEITLAERSVAELRRDYDCLLSYQVAWMTEAAAGACERFAAAGGRVVVCGDALPRLLGTSEAPQRAWCAGAHFLTSRLPDDLPGSCLDGQGAEHVFMQERRSSDGTRFFFLFNRSDHPFAGDLDGAPIQVPARGACFSDDAVIAPKGRECQRLTRFSLAFSAHALPLPCWNVQVPGTGPQWADFLSRSLPEFAGEGAYETPFLLQGNPDEVRLVIEESSFAGTWRGLVNDRQVGPFRPDPLFDCRNFSADITPFLISGTVPRKNTIRFVCTGGMQEMPYLHGAFAASFRHGTPFLPNLTAVRAPMAIDTLCGWHELGYGSYSGCATYTTSFEIAEAGRFHLDCGRVEDAVECFLDGRRIGCRIQPPYRFDLGTLAAGGRQLELRVWNGPGNRERLSNLPAGLLGPVILRQPW